MLPAAAPQAENIRFDLLGEHFELSGGHIKNAVLRAAFYAQREGQSIGTRHLALAAQAEERELNKLVCEFLPGDLQDAVELELAA